MADQTQTPNDQAAKDAAAKKAADEAAAKEEAAKASKLKGAIAVSTGQAGGRRRAGYTFSSEPTVIKVADLDKEQLAALEGDPLLTIKPA